MSRYSVAEAERVALLETARAKVDELCERFDRAYMGDENYDHYLSVTAEVEREERRRGEEQMREAVSISRRNRGEE
jgi:hypothetical protein